MKPAFSIPWCRAIRVLPWILAMGLCLAATVSPAYGQAGRIELSMSDQTLSASIRSAPLRDVISRVENELGIWIQGTHHVTDETLSLEFESMRVDKGLDRILSSTNYSLVFDEQGDVLGVILLSSASAPTVRPRSRTVRPRTLPTMPRRTLPRSRTR
jgi:hypothetical protein